MVDISVIIPVYNVEKYLRKCVDSVINQKFRNLEIILVDDGSIDNSGAICDEYAKIDSRIKVIHKKNEGLSSARNVGLDICTGRYISFVDSDDWISEDMYSKLFNIAEQNNADLVQCDFVRTEKELETNINIDDEDVKMISRIQAQNDIYSDRHTYAAAIVVWNKLYKRELFNGIRFPVGKVNEDEYVTYKVLYKALKIIKCPYNMYYYRIRKDSITGSSFNLKRLDVLGALKERYKFFKEAGEKDLSEKALNKYGKLIMIYYSKCRFLVQDNSDVLKRLKSEYREIFSIYNNNNCITKVEKYISYIFYIVPDLYAIVIKIMGKYNINVK